MRPRLIHPAWLVFAWLAPATLALAETPTPKVDFVKQIKPILEAHCVKCHGPEDPSSGYQIYKKDLAFKPGDSEETPITPNHLGDSALYQRLRAAKDKDRMPQKAKPLPAETIALIKAWIEQGAAWPDGVDLDLTNAKHADKSKK